MDSHAQALCLDDVLRRPLPLEGIDERINYYYSNVMNALEAYVNTEKAAAKDANYPQALSRCINTSVTLVNAAGDLLTMVDEFLTDARKEIPGLGFVFRPDRLAFPPSDRLSNEVLAGLETLESLNNKASKMASIGVMLYTLRSGISFVETDLGFASAPMIERISVLNDSIEGFNEALNGIQTRILEELRDILLLVNETKRVAGKPARLYERILASVMRETLRGAQVGQQSYYRAYSKMIKGDLRKRQNRVLMLGIYDLTRPLFAKAFSRSDLRRTMQDIKKYEIAKEVCTHFVEEICPSIDRLVLKMRILFKALMEGALSMTEYDWTIADDLVDEIKSSWALMMLIRNAMCTDVPPVLRAPHCIRPYSRRSSLFNHMKNLHSEAIRQASGTESTLAGKLKRAVSTGHAFWLTMSELAEYTSDPSLEQEQHQVEEDSEAKRARRDPMLCEGLEREDDTYENPETVQSYMTVYMLFTETRPQTAMLLQAASILENSMTHATAA